LFYLHHTEGRSVDNVIANIEAIGLIRGWDLRELYLVAPFGFCNVAYRHCKDARMEKHGGRNVVIVPAVSGDITIHLGTSGKTIFVMRQGDAIDQLEWY